MHRGFYVIGRASVGVVWLAGPYPTMQYAWAHRERVRKVFNEQAPKIKLLAFGVGNMFTDESYPLPAGALNGDMLERYWTDGSGRLHCAHGLLAPELRLCVTCERDEM